METTNDAYFSNGWAWCRRCSRRGALRRRSRRYRGRVSAITWYGVWEGPHRSNSLLLSDLRLAHIWRRRMTRTLAMDGLGTVAVVEEVPGGGEAGGIEVESPPSHGMVCRKALIGQTACYCLICVWHTYGDDE